MLMLAGFGLPAALLSLTAGGFLLLLHKLTPRLGSRLSARPYRLQVAAVPLPAASAYGPREAGRLRATIRR
jgi:hypothetical protein